MPHEKRSHFIALVVLINMICWTTANAQNNRSAVSLDGTDTASCTVPDPCRTFGVAISRTNNAGEVIVLSSAGYGPFTVDRSVQIISPNALHAALAPTTGSAITINATGISVVLGNLFLNSLGASIGIDVLNAAELNVESCSIAGFGNGILQTSSGDLSLSVKDSSERGNAFGLNLSPMGGVTRVTVDRTRIERSTSGAFHVNPAAGATVDSMIKESLLTSSGGNGIAVISPSADTISTNVESCVFVHNNGRALSGGGASTRVIRVSQSYISNNGTGLFSTGGDDLRSFGNNRVQGNGTNGAFTSTIPLQ